MKKSLQSYLRRNRRTAERFHRMILPGLDYQTVGAVCQLDPRKILGADTVLPDEWNSTYLLHFLAHDTVIFGNVRRKKVWDAESIARTLHALIPGRTYDLVDVGANIGLFSIQLMDCLRAIGRAKDIGQILALEPVPLIRRIAQANFSAVGLDPSALQECALGRRREDLQIFLDAGNGGNNSLLPDQVPNQLSETITVRVDTLDKILIERGALENNILLKIDVQGFEADVILGISDTLWQQVEVLVLEISPSALTKLSPDDIETLFARLDSFDVLEVFHDATGEASGEVTVVSLSELRRMSTDPKTEYFNLVGHRK